jgi:hypothetical protein
MSNIDWSKMITAQMKAEQAAAALLTQVQAETARLRSIADVAIAPLQDAVDIDEATAEEEAKLKLWKKFRIALNRLPEQPGYPADITWPVMPE